MGTKIVKKTVPNGSENVSELWRSNGTVPDETLYSVAPTARDHYINFIDTLDWSAWCTGTTKYELTLKGSRRLMERYASIIKRTLNGNCQLRIFWVSEPFEAKDGMHVHFLLDLRPELRYTDLYKLWQVATGAKKKGEWHRMEAEKFLKSRGAAAYCTKYVFKKQADFDLIC